MCIAVPSVHKRVGFVQNGSCGGAEHDSGVTGGGTRSEDGVPWEREVETGRLHFVKFETRHIEAWLRFVQEELLRDGSPPRLGGSVKLTGGGAFRHRQLIATTLGLRQVVRPPRAPLFFVARQIWRHRWRWPRATWLRRRVGYRDNSSPPESVYVRLEKRVS